MACHAINACVVSYTRETWMNMLADIEDSESFSGAYREIEMFFEEYLSQNVPQDLIRKIIIAYVINGLECIYHYVGEEDNGFAYVYDLAGNGAESVSENDNERDTINNILNEMVEELPPWDHCTSVGEMISTKFMEHITVEGTLQCEDGRHIQVDNIRPW